jgi:hypothetical protein
MRFFKKYNKKGEKIQLRMTNYELRIGGRLFAALRATFSF